MLGSQRELRIELDRSAPAICCDILRSDKLDKSAYRIANISRSGMFIETNEAIALERGESLQFALRIPGAIDSQTMRGTARVRWTRANHSHDFKSAGLGVQVVEFHDNSEKHYLELLESTVLKMQITDIMDKQPPQATVDTKMQDVLAIMVQHRKPYLVATSRDGMPVGMFNLSNLPRTILRDEFRNESLGLHMQPGPLILNVDQTLEHIYGQYHQDIDDYLPVVEEDELVGILATRQVIFYWGEYMELKAKRLNSNYDRAISVIAHDLRTPIGLIQTTNQMLSTDQISAAEYVQSGFPDVVTQSCEMMLNLIDDILDIGKIKAGGVRLNLLLVDIEDLIKSIAVAFSTTAMIKRIEIKVRNEGPLPRIKADPARLEQVLNNLVSNAIKFTQDGGTIEVGSRLKHSKIEFWVKDNGPGISEQSLGNLFEEYSNLENRGTRGEKSTGLGLAITKKLVEAHSGKITVNSKKDLGTTFVVTLPISELQ